MPPAFGIGRGSFSASLFADAGRPRSAAAVADARGQAVRDRRPDDRQHRRRRRSRTIRTATSALDAKYGVTQNLTADLTYNTDFAQVEADEQQVNLTRFSLFFPEKRDFFLENQGIFTFGGAVAARGHAAAARRIGDMPLLFYSRRIGLNQGSRGADPRRRPR